MPMAIRFTHPEVAHLGAHIAHAAGLGLPLAPAGRHQGRPGAVIVGLGPSLGERPVMARIAGLARRGWHVFAIKEAVRLLIEAGLPVHYAVNMDPGATEAARTPIVGNVTYCVASSCHPALFRHLAGGNASVWLFHSACGWPGEVTLYRRLFAAADVMVGGYTVANRALSLARYLGFRRLVLAGADFGWREGGGYYAPGVTAKPLGDGVLSDHGRVDGRPWFTRPDLLASATHVARLVKAGEVRVLGDSLAASLARRDAAFIDAVCPVCFVTGCGQLFPSGDGMLIGQPAMSPDGRMVAFRVCFSRQQCRIGVYAVESGAAHLLNNPIGWLMQQPSFSHDARQLVATMPCGSNRADINRRYEYRPFSQNSNTAADHVLAAQGFTPKGRSDAGFEFSVPGSGRPLTNPLAPRLRTNDGQGSVDPPVSPAMAATHRDVWSDWPSEPTPGYILIEKDGTFRTMVAAAAAAGSVHVRAHGRDGGRVQVDAHDWAAPAR